MSEQSKTKIDPILDSLEIACRTYLNAEHVMGPDLARQLYSTIEDQLLTLVLDGELSVSEVTPDARIVTTGELRDGDQWYPDQARSIVHKLLKVVQGKREVRYVG
jgi:hypothetical protein